MVATRLDAEQQAHPIPDPAPPTNYYTCDRHLQLGLARYFENDPEGLQWAEALLRDWGETCAREIEPLYVIAEKNEPVLKQYDRRGDRVDEIIFHPSYREIEKRVYGFGMAAMSNVADFKGLGKPAPQLVKFAAMYMYAQAEGSISCPVSMTDIMARVLNKYASQELIERYVPRLTSLDQDQHYTGAMFLTEKAGGSDVGATQTTARRAGDAWELNGDKWFCSNVNADLILTLARPEGGPPGTRGLGLFLVPRVLPDGRRNPYRINRLKEKLGTRAMASGEVTFQNTTAYLIEPLERGFVMMMEMVNGTRLHSGVGGAGSMRRGVVEATLHARERIAFGKALAWQPLMTEQLADLIVDSEATTSLVLATAHHLDLADQPEATPSQKLFSRLLITLLKRYGTSRGVQGTQAALEIRGGNGYIEDWPNSRMLRDSYVNIIWEGGINMVSFDVLRTLEKEGVWPVYAGQIEGELERVTTPQIFDDSLRLNRDLDQLGVEVNRVMEWPREAREIIAPQLAEVMASLYAATMLLSEANYALRKHSPDADRAVKSVRRYAARILEPALQKLARFQDAPTDSGGIIEGAV